MSDRNELIQSLATNLPPVKPVISAERLTALWLVLSALLVVSLIHLFGPIRANAWHQLATEPRFLTETLFGVLAIAIVGLAGFRAAVPGALSRRFFTLSCLLLAIWLAFYVIGLVSPALAPSMLGKRPHCVWETLVYGLPPVAVAFALMRKRYPLHPVRAALSFGLAAGMMPALYMQIACMYAPAHMLQFHVAPGLLVAGLSVAAAWAFARGQ
jgi:hypothetical protein